MGGRHGDASAKLIKSATGELNKADNGMSSHKTLIVSILGNPCDDHLKAFIGGFGRVQGVT